MLQLHSWISLKTYISNNVVNAFRQEGYDNYPFKEYSDITNIFPNIKLTTKNCGTRMSIVWRSRSILATFLHMTGFKLRKSGINARHFFNLCYDKRLTEADFDFSADGTTEMKMRVLPSLMKKNLSAKMLGDYNMSQPKLYTDKIAGSLSACMGFVRDGGEGRFVPNTVLEGDIRTKVKAADRIIATYRKSRSEEQYSEIVFTAKKVEWEKIVLPDEYSYLVLPE